MDSLAEINLKGGYRMNFLEESYEISETSEKGLFEMLTRVSNRTKFESQLHFNKLLHCEYEIHTPHLKMIIIFI